MDMEKMWWLYISKKDLAIEKEQLIDEGRDISSLEKEFNELSEKDLENDKSAQAQAQALLDKTVKLPARKDYKYVEPSDIDGIKKQRPAGPRKMELKINARIIKDKLLGAWLGRCAGCMLGKPVEGWHFPAMKDYLKGADRYPLSDYFTARIPAKLQKDYKLDTESPCFLENIKYMVEDDDTNYTVTGLAVMKKHGKDFKPSDVAQFWIENIPILHTCTAERVAYRNFALMIDPPDSASFRNPYREWIGAQIRADFFGYAALGNPELAADFAWRDASISHVKNGIYSEMWVAAMLAAAAVESDIKKVIEIGLSEIPQKSRFSEAIRTVMSWHEQGIGYDTAVERIHKRWDEKNNHHWCHTISNAQIVVLGLLWGNLDYEKSICKAVHACFDTDCNGATAGSVVGMILGAKKLPEKWIGSLNDTIMTGIAGYNKTKISELAEESFNIFKKVSV